ncbi:hypothetical protein QTG54_015288 [Skeletonema marinoi]|uniref:Uncharacterized protein n=1 Tax=Skeletonema marinoi TaxID=267567 RepID=A0AAD8XV35_9STRA|nr:hypothetical protein QTG54_015288 [Skeletonema marinoi]
MLICQWCRWLFLTGFLITSTRIRESSSFSPPLSSRTRILNRSTLLQLHVPENFDPESSSPTINNNSNNSKQQRSKDNPEAQRFFRGAPSTPGFKPGQFEKLTRWAISTSSNRPVVAEYDPTAYGYGHDGRDHPSNDFSECHHLLTLGTRCRFVCVLSLHSVCNRHCRSEWGDVTSLINNLTWTSFEIPHSKDPIIDTLGAINGLWEYQLSLTIFTLSFFCGYGDVDGTTGYARADEGNALHGEDSNVGDGTTAAPTHKKRDARKLVDDVARYLRMSHTFFWASTPTHSDGFGDTCVTEGGIIGDDDLLHRNFDASQFGPMLLSDEGLDMLVDYEQLSQREKEALVATDCLRVNTPMSCIRCIDGMERGELRGTQAMEDNILRLLNELRAEYFNIGDYNAGRMPMAYVQVMEVFVDTLTILAPLALYTKMGTFNIISSGLLTLFFKGLLELSKSFLDPFGREGYRAHNIRVDVLVSELNFGASSRWIDAGDALPSEILISDDDVDQVGSSAAPFVATNEQSSHSVTMESHARVEDNYDMLGRMTKDWNNDCR